MRHLLFVLTCSAVLVGSPLAAQHLHTNHEWDECSIVIDPSLTQAAWHQFVREVGLVAVVALFQARALRGEEGRELLRRHAQAFEQVVPMLEAQP